MAPKASPKSPGSVLQGKAYKDGIQELYSSTALQPRDIDQKACQLLDALQEAGKGDEACQHLKTQLEGITREKVQNWRAYVYSLIRAFDSDIYQDYKKKSGGNRRRERNQPKPVEAAEAGLNAKAQDFVPGSWWKGDANKGTLEAAAAPMGYPMNMMMMPQMMYPQMQMAQMAAAGGAPPPPPQKAAEVSKAGEAEAPAVPEKSADATVSLEAKAAEKPAAEAAATPAAEAR